MPIKRAAWKLVPQPTPRAEQRRIVAKVEQLMALVDELETQLAASRANAAVFTAGRKRTRQLDRYLTDT